MERFLLGGGLFGLGGQARKGIGRLYPNGVLDTNFTASISPSVWTLAIQQDGKVLAGGQFTVVNDQWRQNLARLNADGTLDTSFSSSAGSYVYCLAVQPDNKIVVAGQFTTLCGQACNRIGRLNSDGTLENAFGPGADNYIRSVVLQADGKILVGGSFMNLRGQPRARIGRLNSDGMLDNSFNPGSGSEVSALTLQPDGGILAGGSFTNLGGQSRSHFARLRNTDPAAQVLTMTGSTVTWKRGGTAPEFWRTLFEASTNNLDWWNIGASTRGSGAWQVNAVQLPISATIRARGFVSGGASQTSTWFIEDQLVLSRIPPLIITTDDRFGLSSNQFSFNFSTLPGQMIIIEVRPTC